MRERTLFYIKMDSLMMREEPLFRKCCFVVPLKCCLQTWACIKLAVNGIAICYILFMIVMIHAFGPPELIEKPSVYHFLIFILFSVPVDVGFLITLLIGIYKKSFDKLRVFYYYQFYVLAAEIVILTTIYINTLELIVFLFGVPYFLLDLSIILTVKSEMIKLRNKEQYDFTKMPAKVCETAVEGDIEGTGKLKTKEEESLENL